MEGTSGNTLVKSGVETNVTVTNSTFNDYFETDGTLKSEVTADKIIFEGEFSNISSNVIKIDRPVQLVSNKATLNNISINVAEGAIIDGFIFNTSLENAIEIYASNVTIVNNVFTSSLSQGKNNIVIKASEVSNLTIKNNEINMKGTNTASTINGVIDLEDVTAAQIVGNKINAEIPSSATVYGPAPDYKATYAAYVIQVTGDNNIISDNEITAKYSCVLGSYDSLYSILINGDKNVVSKNSIKLNGNTYVYGISANGDDVNLTENNITILSSNYCGNGISINDPFKGVISKNIVNVTTKNVAYGVNEYFEGDITSVYDGNKFILNSNSVYGMEIMGYDATIINNEINATGNYTLGIAVFLYEGEVKILNNNIFINGTGLGNATKGDMIPSMNVGMYIAGSIDETTVSGNNITAIIPSCAWGTESEAIYVTADDCLFSNNKINVSVSNRKGNWDSVFGVKIKADGVTFENNDLAVNGVYYAYGLQVDGDDITVDGNNITVNNPNYYSNGIDVSTMGSGSFSGVISNNNITSTAKDVAYGITSWGDVEANYDNNKIVSKANSVYALEAMGKEETIANNEIDAKGNYTMGIVVGGSEATPIVKDNKINLEGKGLGTPTVGDTIASCNAGIFITKDIDSAQIIGNEINASIPSCDWTSNSAGIISDANDVLFDGNKLNISVSNAVGAYDSIYGLKVAGDDVTIQNNEIFVNGTNYAYGLKASAGENFKICSNNLTVVNNNNYASGITVENPFKGIVNDNIVDVTAKECAYGIYSSSWGSDLESEYKNNNISVDGKTSYGFELIGTKETVSNNNVVANGEYTMGIATSTPEISIVDNSIISNGTGKTNATTMDMFGATNQGILLMDNSVNAEILRNNISTTGDYTVNVLKSDDNPSTVKDNYLLANELFGDDSVNNITGVVVNNTPAFNDILSAENVVKYYKNATQYSVEVVDVRGNPISNKKVTIVINGPTFKDLKYDRLTDEKGVATLPINLAPGEYSIEAFTNDSEVIGNNVTVLPMTYSLEAEDIVMFVKNGTSYEVSLTDANGNPVAGEKVTLTLNCKAFKDLKYDRVTDQNGIASLPINLAVGQYTVTAKYGSEAITTTVNVLAKQYNLVAENVVKYYKNGTQYSVKLLDEDGNAASGKTVTVILNGASFNNLKYNIVTDANGIATLPINLAAGSYTIAANYGEVSTTNTVDVLPTLTAEDLTKAVNKPASFTAKLVDGQGNPLSGAKVSFTITGKTIKTVTYTKVTDANGIASLPINLAQGDYKITVSVDGGAKATGNVKVTKATA
ncbi:MAG: Ig-like domain-containing protein [Methanobrevibacter sp.]|uniref:Ig-like domain-containing protein n=1 Tax=Methanobrevibacter sp. TaxID=66852 RepID=UPI0026DF444B|nr:Ig-like domain-containing protein [Methanobrevibacter sp.]MDO5848039.1 Ig-like domain-containing protein [Methanobrevibacter sp.]